MTVRSLAIRVAARGSTLLRLDARRLRRLGPDGVVVLNLHSVAPDRASLIDPITPAALDRFVAWLERHCRIATFGELGAAAAGGRPAAVLSFDDGYRDFLEHAAPVLAARGVRANLNVVCGCVDSGTPPWETLLLDHLDHAARDDLARLRVPGLALDPPGRDRASRMRHAIVLTRHLKNRPRSERDPLLGEVLAQLRPPPRTTAMLSASEVAELSEVHEVGVHSFAHDSMGFESDDHLRADLARCRSWAAAHLRRPADVYAFPNGSHRPEQIALVRTTGFGTVLLVEERISTLGAPAHPRVTLHGPDAATLRTRIARAA